VDTEQYYIRMDVLIDDNIYEIYTKLPLSDAFHLSLTAKRLSRIFGSPSLWKFYVHNRIEQHTFEMIRLDHDKLTFKKFIDLVTLRKLLLITDDIPLMYQNNKLHILYIIT